MYASVAGACRLCAKEVKVAGRCCLPVSNPSTSGPGTAHPYKTDPPTSCTTPSMTPTHSQSRWRGSCSARWGVVFWDLMARENLAVAWRELLWALRRLEARGLVRGGRFVTGFAGEQYALPEAVEELRRTRRSERNGETVRLSAADPLNLCGIVLPGRRVPALRTNRVTYRDGALLGEESGPARRHADPLPVLAAFTKN